MKTYAYIVPIDDGAAPNPYGGICTLAICKPNLRKLAQVGDWILGLTQESDRLIYAMKITEVLSMEAYDTFTQEQLHIKIPDIQSLDIEKHMGDSVYDFTQGDVLLRKSVHSRCTKAMDLAGKNVLLSSLFYYFGNNAPLLPKEFNSWLDLDIDFIELHEAVKKCFFNWLESEKFQVNKIYGTPHRVGLIHPSNKQEQMSCCIRKKVEKQFIERLS